MKKYVLYPGIGRIGPLDVKEEYICGKELAHCYRVPYSECMDTDNDAIKKVLRLGAKLDQLIPLVPERTGVYKLPKLGDKKIIIATGLPEMVRK